MMGVLRAGGSFNIADSAYPVARIIKTIGILKPSYVFICGDIPSARDVISTLAHIGHERIWRIPPEINTALNAFCSFNSEDLAAEIGSTTPAYITFTSGTTGEPKGVVNTHAPLSHFVSWHIREHALTKHDRFSLLSGLSHDPIFRDILTPLSVGATLHIPDQSTIFDSCELANWLCRREITVAHLTPGLGEIIATGAEGQSINLPQIRYLFWGGDALSKRISTLMRAAAKRDTS
jgi:non-ribosomal peptide synthetase component F